MTIPKVQIQTPSERIIKTEKAKLEPQVTDSDGNVYTLKVPDPVDEARLNMALGEHSINIALRVQTLPLIYVDKINGEPFNVVASMNGLLAALKVLGRTGAVAVSDAVQKFLKEEQGSPEHQMELNNDIKK